MIAILLLPLYVIAQLPVVIWHGLGQDCCSGEVQMIVDEIKQAYPSIYVRSIRIGPFKTADLVASSSGNANDQVRQVCEDLKKDKRLSQGFNAIGISQGGLLMRAYVERCNDPPVRKLITFGTPHMGVTRFPGCVTDNSQIDASVLPDKIRERIGGGGSDDKVSCRLIDPILETLVYTDFFQEHVMPAQYFKDLENLEEYRANNKFLVDINNEGREKNGTYKENMLSLDRFVMFAFSREDTVLPQISTLFGWTRDGKDVGMEETELYGEDWIGLKGLDQRGAIDRIMIANATHTEYPVGFLQRELMPLLNVSAPAGIATSGADLSQNPDALMLHVVLMMVAVGLY